MPSMGPRSYFYRESRESEGSLSILGASAVAVGCEAAISALRAEHHHRLTLAAARDADGVLSALVSHHERPIQYRLNRLAREHLTRRRRTVHIESGAIECVAECHRLQLGGERRGIACRNAHQNRDRQGHQKYFFHRGLPYFIGLE